jgi:hypothetical protein
LFLFYYRQQLICKHATKPTGFLDGDLTIDTNRCRCQWLVKKLCEVVGGFKC